VRALTVWRMKHTVTSTVQAAKEWQQQLRLPTTPSGEIEKFIWRHLYDSMYAAQKPKSKLKFVMLDKESSMSTLRRREEFQRICSKEALAEKAQNIEVTIPVKNQGLSS